VKEQIETAVPRRKFVVVDSDKARKTATGHSCKPLGAGLRKKLHRLIRLCIFEKN
jgi:hypothetical protein